MTREKQLQNNIDYVVGGYLNEMEDYDAPALTESQVIDMVRAEIFDIKESGGCCKYAKGICDDLKFLGNDYIDKTIIESAADILK